MPHAYVVTAQPATAAVGSIVCSFTGNNSRDLLLAKGSHIEVHRLSETNGNVGLQLTIDVNFFGKIVSLDKYRPSSSIDQDYLFVLTERKNFCVLKFDQASKNVKTISAGNVKDKVGRDIATGLCGIVDNQHHIVSMLVYEGLLKIFPIDPTTGAIKDCFNVRIEEIRFLDLKFLCGYRRPTFALLYEDARQNKHIKTYSIDLKERELIAGPWSHMYVDRSSSFMIPEPCGWDNDRSGQSQAQVPGQGGGVVLVGMNMVSFINHASASSTHASTTGNIVAPLTIVNQTSVRFLAYGSIDSDGSRYLLGDIYGTLYVLVLKRQIQTVQQFTGASSSIQQTRSCMTTVGLALEPLGTTSIASQLCYLTDGLVYVNSRMGDSQLIKLNSKPVPVTEEDSGASSAADTHGATASHVSVLETFTNIGPIVDMVVVENHPAQELSSSTSAATSTSTAQVQIVTCSGAYKDGSLRIIKSGIGMREQADLEIPGIKGMWSLCPGAATTSSTESSSGEVYDEYLVQAFISETRVLRITADEMEECEIPGFSSEETTLYCGNMCGNTRWLQVTPTRIVLVDSSSLQMVGQYNCASTAEMHDRYAVVTANQEQIVVATTAGRLLYFEVSDGSHVDLKGSIKLEYDIACLCIRPLRALDQEETDPSSSMECDESFSTSAANMSAHSSQLDSSANYSVRVCDNAVGGQMVHRKQSVSSLISPTGKASLLAVGLWSDNSIRLFALPALVEVTRVSLGGSGSSTSGSTVAQVRDVLLVDLSPSLATLLAGMGDGTMISYTLEHYSSGSGTGTSSRGQGNEAPTLTSKRSVTLGTQPISLSCFTNNNHLYVLACCDRPTVIYEQNNKLLFSIVNTTGGSISTAGSKPTRMVSFHTEMFPEGLAVSSESGLSITTVGEIRKIHVQKHALKESPRRICYSTGSQIYTVLTQKTTVHPVDKLESSIDRVLFMRESGTGAGGVGTGSADELMETLHVHTLDPMESAMSCTSCSLSVNDASGITGAVKQYVIVGTAQTILGEVEPSRGRILVFDISSSVTDSDSVGESMDINGTGNGGKPVVTLIYEKEVKGAVFSLACLMGRLVAGVGSKIQMYRLNLLHQRPELKHECSHYGHILALAVKAEGDFVLVGDLLRSITLLRYTPPASGIGSSSSPTAGENGTLTEVARDFNVNSMRAVEFFHNSNFYLGTEDFGNLFIAKRQFPAAVAPTRASSASPGGSGSAGGVGATLTPEEKGRLLIHSEFHVGDTINTLRPGSLNVQPREQQQQQQQSDSADDSLTTASLPEYQSILYGTVNGAIGSVISIPTPVFEFYSALENAIRSVIQGVGGFSHAEYRALYNGRRNGSQNNSVDGDLIELFPVMATADMEKVVTCLNNGIRASRASAVAVPRGTNTAVGTGALSDVQRSVLSGSAWSTMPSTGAMDESEDGHQQQLQQPREYTVEDVITRIEEMLRLH